MKYKKNIIRSIGVLVIGAVLTGGGLFLWQNKFNLSFFSGASTNNMQAIVSLGEKDVSGTPPYVTAVFDVLSAKQGKKIDLINRADQGSFVSTLRDQAVLGYNDITKPINDHVIFLVITGQNALVQGIKNKDSISSISTKISKDISNLVELATARPGVFPSGFTIYLATLPDPLDGTGDVTLCNGVIPNYGKEYTKGMVKEINSAIKSTATIYALNVKIVDLEKVFTNRGLTSTKTWFKNCLELNSEGENAISSAFTEAIQSVSK